MRSGEGVSIDGYDLRAEDARLAFPDVVVAGRRLNRGTARVSPEGTPHERGEAVRAAHEARMRAYLAEHAVPRRIGAFRNVRKRRVGELIEQRRTLFLHISERFRNLRDAVLQYLGFGKQFLVLTRYERLGNRFLLRLKSVECGALRSPVLVHAEELVHRFGVHFLLCERFLRLVRVLP